MRTVPSRVVASAVAQLVMFVALVQVVGVHGDAAAVGLTCLLAGWVLLARGVLDGGRARLGPADHVTVTRATIACVVVALTTEAVVGRPQQTSLVVLATLALLLDAVDGWVARRTRTATALGARMDLEVDAFLILGLSVSAALVLSWWVLAIGVLRYAFLAATWVVPWLGGAVPPRYWRKAVAALQGVVLTVATARVLPLGWAEVLVATGLALLLWSFGTQVGELGTARSRDRDAPDLDAASGRLARPAAPARALR